jgi:hypothetical protein
VTCHCGYRAVTVEGCGIRYGRFYGGPHLREVRLITGAREEFLSTVKAISRTLGQTIESPYEPPLLRQEQHLGNTDLTQLMDYFRLLINFINCPDLNGRAVFGTYCKYPHLSKMATAQAKESAFFRAYFNGFHQFSFFTRSV